MGELLSSCGPVIGANTIGLVTVNVEVEVTNIAEGSGFNSQPSVEGDTLMVALWHRLPARLGWEWHDRSSQPLEHDPVTNPHRMCKSPGIQPLMTQCQHFLVYPWTRQAAPHHHTMESHQEDNPFLSQLRHQFHWQSLTWSLASLG